MILEEIIKNKLEIICTLKMLEFYLPFKIHISKMVNENIPIDHNTILDNLYLFVLYKLETILKCESNFTCLNIGCCNPQKIDIKKYNNNLYADDFISNSLLYLYPTLEVNIISQIICRVRWLNINKLKIKDFDYEMWQLPNINIDFPILERVSSRVGSIYYSKLVLACINSYVLFLKKFDCISYIIKNYPICKVVMGLEDTDTISPVFIKTKSEIKPKKLPFFMFTI